MSGKTITRVELSKAVYRTKVGLTRTESSALLDLVLKEITNTIARGETVKLSSFGTFTVPKTPAHRADSKNRRRVVRAAWQLSRLRRE